MDLLDCGSCNGRFLVHDAGDLIEISDSPCPDCGGSLRLIVKSLPGTESMIARALNAHLMEPPAHPDPGA